MSDLMTRGVIMMPLELAMSSELSRMQFHSRAQDLLVERDTYRDLCAEMLKVVESAMKEVEREDRPYRGWHGEALDVITTSKVMLGDYNAT